jgi:heme-degrading monooxygenase HmoA
MPVMAVTLLGLRDPADFDAFVAAAVAVAEQANASKGCLGARALADSNNVYWTITGWEDRPSMSAFTQTAPHLATEARPDEWCDEATFVDWEQEAAELPDWATGYDRLVQDGQVAPLTHGSPANASLGFPPPVIS